MPRSVLRDISLKVADAVWVGTALLTREKPRREDFTVEEIVDRVAHEGFFSGSRSSVYQHVVQHCVANRPVSSGRYRMLFATGKSKRRLFHDGDPYIPSRRTAKITPKRDELPEKYWNLLDWYSSKWGSRPQKEEEDPLLSARGIAKGLWADEHPDDYVKRLREGWE
jgi:hypothetical protein